MKKNEVEEIFLQNSSLTFKGAKQENMFDTTQKDMFGIKLLLNNLGKRSISRRELENELKFWQVFGSLKLERVINKLYPKRIAEQHNIAWKDTFLQWDLPDTVEADFALTLALPISHKTKRNPQEVAREIIKITDCSNLEQTITKQGYINFCFPISYYQKFFKETLENEGRNLRGEEKDIRLNLEYVSANPTGYLHLAHFRHAVIGNTLANVYQFCGYQITREYYVNDRGGQIISLVNSVYHFYHELQNIPLLDPIKIEYSGQATQEIAKKLIEKWGKKKHLSLLEELNKKSLIYTKEGATFFRSSLAGDDKDRVIIKQDGADHHGTIARLKKGQTERFSKRAGNTIELEGALQYMDMDQLKFFLLEKDSNQPLSINAELLKENKEKTRLYYIQYAYARCHQILKKAQEKGLEKISSKNIVEENKPHHLIHYLYELSRT
ncbi:2408_t:CDS:2 [Funneliformis geosporum]|uniref:arginine--tRNA ligase n=1 Tax=Funneliformis geosporum TaxID=1117311 RepID=A0A9W4SXF2_9GLOM|nr:2408_t:CDS:2 [Funneliformis geosporum]